MSFFSKLSKSSGRISGGITSIFAGKKLDEDTLVELEELLITSDFGPEIASEIVAKFGKEKFGKAITADEIKKELAIDIAAILEPVAKNLVINKDNKPHVIIMVGVNGNGKTTTIGKLTSQFKKTGHSVMLAACDTFRAAAASQLKVWADRTKTPLISGEEGADPASVAFQALQKAKEEKADILIIDTAGRLQNKADLMEELAKIIRVMKKLDVDVPHDVIQVIDATTGQNALSQVDVFKTIVQVTGLIITKLDGTAKGGILVAISKKFQLPIHAIGVGEQVDDLTTFDTKAFSEGLVGI